MAKTERPRAADRTERAKGRAAGGAANGATDDARRNTDWILIAVAIAMLVVWAVWTFVINDAPGWVHLLLSAGVFLLIWRIVALGTPDPKD